MLYDLEGSETWWTKIHPYLRCLKCVAKVLSNLNHSCQYNSSTIFFNQVVLSHDYAVKVSWHCDYESYIVVGAEGSAGPKGPSGDRGSIGLTGETGDPVSSFFSLCHSWCVFFKSHDRWNKDKLEMQNKWKGILFQQETEQAPKICELT